MEISQDVKAGQAVYSKLVLSIYDIWVLGISNRFIWKCPTPELLENFNQNITPNHLDIGVGTGYYLDKCRFPSLPARVALMDLNQNSLDVSAQRLRRFQPEKYRRNVLDPIKLETQPFDSVSLNFLFHCMPGKLSEKLKVLDNIDHLLNAGAKIFGSTILSSGVSKGPAAIKLMKIYNKKGIFSNQHDSLEMLEKGLAARYNDFDIKTNGCVAIFNARK